MDKTPAAFIQLMLDAEVSTRGQYGGNIRFDRVGRMDVYHFVISSFRAPVTITKT